MRDSELMRDGCMLRRCRDPHTAPLFRGVAVAVELQEYTDKQYLRYMDSLGAFDTL